MASIDKSNLLTKEYVLKAVLECEDLHIEEQNESGLVTWDDMDAKIIPFRFLECLNSGALSELIHISNDIPIQFQIDKAAFVEYLWNICDKNAFITLDELVVIWSEPDDPEAFELSSFVDSEAKRLYEALGDEYVFEIGQGYLGQLWFERNIVVVNMGEIVRTAMDIEKSNADIPDPYFSMENQVLVGFLTTAIHELRHLQMDTNCILPEDLYPLYLGTESAVEEYCTSVFEENPLNYDVLPNLYQKEKSSLSALIESAAIRTSNFNHQQRDIIKAVKGER